MATARPWDVPDGLWELIEPLLPTLARRFRYPGRKRLGDRETLQGILFVLHTGIAWRHLPLELGFGSGATCRRRLDEWQAAGVWDKLHELLLARLQQAGEIEWSRAVVDGSHIQATKGAPKRARARWTEAEPDRSTISWSTPRGSRSSARRGGDVQARRTRALRRGRPGRSPLRRERAAPNARTRPGRRSRWATVGGRCRDRRL